MDPNLSKLDPKLREAYDRVMNGSTTNQAQPNQPAAPQVTQSQPQNITPPPPPVMPASQPTPTPTQVQQSAAPVLDPTPAVNSTIAFNAHDQSVNKGTSEAKKGGGMGKALMIGLLIVVFLLVYTFVWVYLFHLKLPFIG